MIDRREFLGSTAAAALLTGCASMRPLGAGTAGTAAAAQARAIYDSVFERMLQLAPESATNLGLDTGPRAGLKSRLSNPAISERGGWWGPLIDALPQLRAIDRARLPLRDRALRDTAIWFGERAVESRAMPYGVGQRPYVITQLYGAYTWVPNFLDTEHKIETADDAEAYLARLDDYHRNIDAEVTMMRADAAGGVIPPAFIIDKAITQTRRAIADGGASADVVKSVVRRTREKNLPGNWEARAVRLVDGPIAAALGRQSALLQELRGRAGDVAGIGSRPQGARFYANTLRFYTSTGMSAAEVHRLGLSEVARLTAEADPLLRAQGINEARSGSASRRLRGCRVSSSRRTIGGGSSCSLISTRGWIGFARACLRSSIPSPPVRWRSAGCRLRSKWARPAPMPNRPTSKGRGRAFSTSTSRTSIAARASASLPSPRTRRLRAICGRGPSSIRPATFRCSTAPPASPPSGRAGGSMQRHWSTSSASTATIR
jgi:hypothetical protein